jgi:hypothetical protein
MTQHCGIQFNVFVQNFQGYVIIFYFKKFDIEGQFYHTNLKYKELQTKQNNF